MRGSPRPLVVGNWKMHGLGGDLDTVAAIARRAAVAGALRDVMGSQPAPILHGESFTPDTATPMMAAGVDGQFVGGASLNADTFGAVLAAVARAPKQVTQQCVVGRAMDRGVSTARAMEACT